MLFFFFGFRRVLLEVAVMLLELPVECLVISEFSRSKLLEVPEGVLEPVLVGEFIGDSLIGEGAASEPCEEMSAFSLPVMASDIARRPVARDFWAKCEWLCPVGAGDPRPSDDVSLLGRLGDDAIASMLGELPYSNLVTVGERSFANFNGLTNSKALEVRCPFGLVP